MCRTAGRFPAQSGGDLEILSSAVRLVHRTLAVVPPAAAAVALGGVQHAAPPTQDPFSTEGSAADVTTSGSSESTGLDGVNSGDADQGPPRSQAPRKGKKRARNEVDGEVCGTGNSGSRRRSRLNEVPAEEEGRSVDGDDAGRNDENCSRPPEKERSCSLFIAGELVRPQDMPPSAPGRVSSGAETVMEASPSAGVAGSGRKDEGVCTVRRMGGRRGEASWAGRRGEGELGRRLKVQLVGCFHQGTARGCSALVECCLEVSWQRSNCESPDFVSWSTDSMVWKYFFRSVVPVRVC